MEKTNRDIRGIKYSQQSLAKRSNDCQAVITGQALGFRFLLLLFTCILFLTSACLTGIIGSIIGTGFFIRVEYANWIFFSVALAIITWFIETIRVNFAQGLWKAALSIVTVSSLLVFKYHDWQIISSILFFTIVGIGAAVLSLVIGSLSSSLILVLFDKNERYVKKIYFLQIVFFIFVSFLIAYLFGIAIQHRLSLEGGVNFVFVSSVGGFLSGVMFITACLLVSHFADTHFQHFQFLRSWAIALSCWGSTSFYNLDLSNVNFRGAKLANTDLRARKLYRTCFQGVEGLDRARFDSRYMDLEIPKVQKLLTKGCSDDSDFSQLNLRGAYLQDLQMPKFHFIDTDLSGANMQRANLSESFFVRTQVIGVNFSGADLTGICIEDWSVNSQTCFTNVTCDYVYRRLDEQGKPTDRLPVNVNSNFAPREFESLYQQVENVIEIIFKEGENWQAALYSLIKLQTDDEHLNLQLKGVEKRGDVWVVKVTYNETYPKQEVEQILNTTVEEMKRQLAAKEQQIYQLEQEKYEILGIVKEQAKAVADQAKALEGLSKHPLGHSNNFFVFGSNITNLAGSGQIEYGEAASQVRSIVASSADSAQARTILENFLAKLKRQSVATDIETQAELMQQMILAEAQKDLVLKQFLIQQEQQIVSAFPEGTLATAIRFAIAQLRR
ncbi:pentapeptide repeat-containing protein [Scytonema sp. PCC 10023]|uniref:pentapeptide repeat-containing protein n=1 Tax=Scytonema sp. PCC 10023 TaxID=1680591 RepID=UPI0039C6DB24